MSDEITKGQCLCGSIQFQIERTPLWIGHCHCLSCRRNTGAAVATFVGVRDQDIVFTAGERTFYQSSPGTRRGFCASCGTPLTYESDKFPNEVHIYISSLHTPEHFVAQFHVHCAERIPWFDIKDDLPRHAKTTKST